MVFVAARPCRPPARRSASSARDGCRIVAAIGGDGFPRERTENGAGDLAVPSEFSGSISAGLRSQARQMAARVPVSFFVTCVVLCLSQIGGFSFSGGACLSCAHFVSRSLRVGGIPVGEGEISADDEHSR